MLYNELFAALSRYALAASSDGWDSALRFVFRQRGKHPFAVPEVTLCALSDSLAVCVSLASIGAVCLALRSSQMSGGLYGVFPLSGQEDVTNSAATRAAAVCDYLGDRPICGTDCCWEWFASPRVYRVEPKYREWAKRQMQKVLGQEKGEQMAHCIRYVERKMRNVITPSVLTGPVADGTIIIDPLFPFALIAVCQDFQQFLFCQRGKVSSFFVYAPLPASAHEIVCYLPRLADLSDFLREKFLMAGVFNIGKPDKSL